HRAIAEHALAVLVDADLLLDLISVHDSHGVPPVCLLQRRAATLRVAESLCTNILSAFACLSLRRPGFDLHRSCAHTIELNSLAGRGGQVRAIAPKRL